MSGALDLIPADVNIRDSGRSVRFDHEVADTAADELTEGGRFVIVAHGSTAGTVSWYKSTTQQNERWLWVDMDNPPIGVRLYLYACHAGAALSSFLNRCEAFGHSDEVPMPTDGAQAAVLEFLSEVDRLMASTDAFDREKWRVTLGEAVNRAYVKELDNRTGLLTGAALLMLRKSLGFVDE